MGAEKLPTNFIGVQVCARFADLLFGNEIVTARPCVAPSLDGIERYLRSVSAVAVSVDTRFHAMFVMRR